MITLSAADAARELGIAHGTLRKWLLDGRVPGAYRIGPVWAIPAASLSKIRRPARPGRPRKQERSEER